MKKTRDEIADARASNYAEADRVEWERITEKPELMKEVKNLQLRYELPITTNVQKFIEWMGWAEPIEIDTVTATIIYGPRGQRREKLGQEIKAMMKYFNIADKWEASLRAMVLRGFQSPDSMSMGFPSFEFDRKENGETIEKCIITPETDLNNPLVLQSIKMWQALRRKQPPFPLVDIKTKKKDWRPVWEWRNRHPDTSDKEIAVMLNYNRVTVSRALERLDKQFIQHQGTEHE